MSVLASEANGSIWTVRTAEVQISNVDPTRTRNLEPNVLTKLIASREYPYQLIHILRAFRIVAGDSLQLCN
jgi:hypothetical protein